MRSNKYRKLQILYAYAITFHFPASQAKPHLGVHNRHPMNLNRWGDDEFTDLFIFTKAEFVRTHDHVAPLINVVMGGSHGSFKFERGEVCAEKCFGVKFGVPFLEITFLVCKIVIRFKSGSCDF